MEDSLLNRVIQYRVDFAYSRQNAYNAYKRISKKNIIHNRVKNILNVLSILLSVVSTSTLMIFLSQHVGNKSYIYISTALSIFSLLISVYFLRHNEEVNSAPYLIRAEEYSMLYKKARNVEALYRDGQLIDLADTIRHFQVEFEKISRTPLLFSQDDFESTKQQIRRGDLLYSEEDLNNT